MKSHGTTKAGFRKATSAIGIAVLTVAASTLGTTPAWGAASGPSGTVKIITWINPPAVAAFKKIDAEFEKAYPNITVQLETAANVTTGYASLLTTTVDAASADIVTSTFEIQPLPLNPTRANMNEMQYWASSNVFLPLNGQPWLKNFNSAAMQTETYNGHVDGVLSGVYQRVVFYNKADFAKYHLSVPTTYSQFITLCNTLESDHLTPLWLGVGSGASIYVQDFLTMPLHGQRLASPSPRPQHLHRPSERQPEVGQPQLRDGHDRGSGHSEVHRARLHGRQLAGHAG